MRPRPTPADRNQLAVLAGLVVLALAVRLDRIGWSLPSVYEEATPFKKAWEMWGLASPWGFGPLRGFDPNPHWFQYPSLTFYLQFLGQGLTMLALRLAGSVHSADDVRALVLLDPTAFYLVGRSITALFGAATVLSAWGLARHATGARAAAWAGLLVALHPTLIAKSKVIEVDVPLAFFVTLGLLMAVRLSERATMRGAIGAGAVAGLATSTKYPGLVLLATMLFALWRSRGVVPAAGRGPARGAAASALARARRATSKREHGWIARSMALVAACAIVLFVTSPYLLLARTEVSRDLAIGRQLMTLGHFGVAAGMAYGSYARDWFASLMGWPLGLAALLGLVWMAARRTAWGLCVAGLCVPYLAVVGSWQMKADRYLLPVVPAGAACAAVLLEALAAAAPLRARPRIGAAVATVGGLVCLVPLAARLPAHWATLRTDTRQLARQWIERDLPAGSLVASELYGPDLRAPLDLQQADAALLDRLGHRGGLARVYALQTIPMFVMAPERSEKFYQLGLYSDADAIVVTSSVRERYRGEPARYATQLAFYDSLAARWPEAASFDPAGGPGPAISIHVNPAGGTPFSARGAIPPVDTTIATSGGLSGGEGYHYFNVGLNAEWFGYRKQAEEAYLLALRFGASEPLTYVSAATRLAAYLNRQGHPGQSLGLLRICGQQAPGPAEAAQLRSAENDLRRVLGSSGSR